MFNNIYIKHNDAEDSTNSIIKVPISYGPIQKFLARLEQKPDLRKRQAITLPRMAFELTSIQYDTSRKVSSMQTFRAIKPDGGEQVKAYMPAPYNLGIQLSIITKYNDDMLQIIEQILPFFQPQFNLTIDLVSSIGEKRDIPMILENIQMNDNYEGDFSERRNLIYTLNFTAKTYIFGPIVDNTEGLIKKVQVDYYSDTNIQNASRQLRYTVSPRAIKDYNNDQSAVITKDVGVNESIIRVSTTIPFSLNSYVMINDEEMLITGVSTNELTVKRAQDGTVASEHISGSYVNALTQSDDDLIGPEDDFGFNEDRFDFGDGKVWSTTKNTDV